MFSVNERKGDERRRETMSKLVLWCSINIVSFRSSWELFLFCRNTFKQPHAYIRWLCVTCMYVWLFILCEMSKLNREKVTSKCNGNWTGENHLIFLSLRMAENEDHRKKNIQLAKKVNEVKEKLQKCRKENIALEKKYESSKIKVTKLQNEKDFQQRFSDQTTIEWHIRSTFHRIFSFVTTNWSGFVEMWSHIKNSGEWVEQNVDKWSHSSESRFDFQRNAIEFWRP